MYALRKKSYCGIIKMLSAQIVTGKMRGGDN